MSSFYDDASLVVIPSGYKTSKIYAEKPTDGSGDLTFTRASSATRIAPNGLIEEVRTNLILQSNTFSTTWVNSDSNETSGQAGYDGTNNAWRLTTTLSGGFIFQGVAIGGITTFSIYAKAGTQNGIILYSVHVAQGINFNLSTGVVGAAFVAAPLGSRIESIGNGWYRCSITVSSSSTNNFRIYVSDGSNPSLGNVLIQNSQVEAGDIATNYIPTTTAAVSVGPVSNVPRLDYTNSSCPRLLLEPQRTNLITFSEQFDNADWFKGNSTVTANNTISPSGYQDADRVVFSAIANANIQRASATATTVGTQYTISFYARADAAVNNVKLSSVGVDTDLAITTTWQRFTRTVTANATTTASTLVVRNGVATTIYLWGFQFEAGSYATSYIPTLSASVTRVADAASKTGISSLIGQTEGTVFAEIYPEEFVNGSYISISDGANSANRIIFGFEVGSIDSGTLRVFGATGLTGSGTYNRGQRIKVAIGYKSGSSVLYVNGNLVNTSTSTFTVTLTRFGFDSLSGSQPFVGRCSQALLFKTRLTNAQLAELTTL